MVFLVQPLINQHKQINMFEYVHFNALLNFSASVISKPMEVNTNNSHDPESLKQKLCRGHHAEVSPRRTVNSATGL